jgi:hypothetical protein
MLGGTTVDMGLFSRHTSEAVDLRDRDYVLTGCPLIAQDNWIVLVDLTVRLAVRQPTDEKDLVLGYDPTDENAVHAVCVTVLRLLAEDLPSDDLLVGRARVAEAAERGLSFGPFGSRFDARVLSVEVRPHDPTLMTTAHEFRVVAS